MRAQCPQPGHLVNVDRLTDSPGGLRSKRTQFEVTLAEIAGLLTDRDRTSRRHRLQARSEVRRMSDRRVLNSPAGLDRAHHHFAGIDADARFGDMRSGGGASLAVFAQLLLHLECGV